MTYKLQATGQTDLAFPPPKSQNKGTRNSKQNVRKFTPVQSDIVNPEKENGGEGDLVALLTISFSGTPLLFFKISTFIHLPEQMTLKRSKQLKLPTIFKLKLFQLPSQPDIKRLKSKLSKRKHGMYEDASLYLLQCWQIQVVSS